MNMAAVWNIAPYSLGLDPRFTSATASIIRVMASPPWWWRQYAALKHQSSPSYFFFCSVPVCAITASGVPGGTLVSMNRFSTLCGWLVKRKGWRVKGWIWPSEQAISARANSWLDYQRPLEKGERERGNEKFCLSVPVGLQEFFYMP
jgi:hypothetical protein